MGYEFQNFEEALNSALGADEGERRDGPRFLTVYRVARVFTGSDLGLVRVVNISNHGLMIATKLELGLGTEVTVDLSEKCSLTGQVVWARPGHCGIKLKAPIDCRALLARLRRDLRMPGEWPLRLTLDRRVVCSTELGVQIIRLRDISQRGAKIVHDGRFRAGLKVKLHLTERIECRGVIRWAQDGLAGLQFEKELSVPELGSIKHL